MGLADWLGIQLQEWVLKHPGQVVLTVVCMRWSLIISIRAEFVIICPANKVLEGVYRNRPVRPSVCPYLSDAQFLK